MQYTIKTEYTQLINIRMHIKSWSQLQRVQVPVTKHHYLQFSWQIKTAAFPPHLLHAGHRVGVSLHQLLERDGLHVRRVADLRTRARRSNRGGWHLQSETKLSSQGFPHLSASSIWIMTYISTLKGQFSPKSKVIFVHFFIPVELFIHLYCFGLCCRIFLRCQP